MKRTAILVGLLAILLGGVARGADAPTSTEDLLRQAKTTESADRDVPKAIELYERVLAGAGRADPEREAAYATLDAKRIRGLRLVDQSLEQVVTYLRTVTGLSFLITPKVHGSGKVDAIRVNIPELEDVAARELLDLVTLPHELRWEPRNGVITIGLKDEIAETPTPDAAALGAAQEAALRLLHLREARGEREEALKVAMLLWTDLAKGLSAEQIALVRTALGRLLRPGQSLTGPHGSIYVDAPKVVDGGLSPLEQTILEQLRTLKGLDGDRRSTREYEISEALQSVGRETLPALEYAIRHEGSDLAPFAARLYAQLAGSDAFALFEDLLRGADPFVRAAAVEALDDVPPRGDVDEPFAKGLTRILDLTAVAPRRETLRSRIAEAIPPADMFARAQAGGPDAEWWLGRAIRTGHRPAVEAAIQHARAGRSLSDEVIESLGTMYGARLEPDGTPFMRVTLQDADPTGEDRLLALKLLTAQPPSETTVVAIASVAAACRLDLEEPSVVDPAAQIAWRHALTIADPELRGKAVWQLAHLQVAVPPAVVHDMEAVYAQVLARSDYFLSQHQPARHAMLSGPLRQEPAFWRAVAAAIGSAKPGAVPVGLVQGMPDALGVDEKTGQPRLPPPEHDALWVPLLDRVSSQPALSPTQSGAYWLYRAAARGGDPAFLAWVRKTTRTVPERIASGLVDLVAVLYRGPGRLEFALDGLTDRALYSQRLTAEEALRSEFWPAFFERAMRYDEAQLAQATPALQPYFQQVGHRSGPYADGSAPETFAVAARPEWIALMSRAEFRPERHNNLQTIARLAAASGSPAFLALVRERATGPKANRPESGAHTLVDELRSFGGEIPGEWLEDLLKDPGLPVELLGTPLQLLRNHPSPAAKAAIDRLVRTPDSVAAPHLLQTTWRSLRPTVLEIVSTAASEKTESWPRAYRFALVQASGWMKLREAIPFLLTQYQRDLESEAATALDEIRRYHERLATFQTWAQDVAEGRRDLSKLLTDSDPEVRRAAVLSLGALGDRDALPALVRIAKEEKDPKVRAAALEAVERIARSPAPAPAPQPAPDPAPPSEPPANVKYR